MSAIDLPVAAFQYGRGESMQCICADAMRPLYGSMRLSGPATATLCCTNRLHHIPMHIHSGVLARRATDRPVPDASCLYR